MLGGQFHAPAILLPGKTQYPLYRSWVDSRGGLEGCGKFRPSPGFDPRTVQPVASSYIDYAIPANT